MKQTSRTYNSVVNSLVGIFASIITTILNFVVRVMLVKTLGEEINGLHNLFQSIINVMALMEMGLNTAMIIHLYAPIKEQDSGMICGIIHFYRRLYRIIACVFFIIGLIISFTILDGLITSTIPINIIRLYFMLFVASFSIGYLTNYRRCIIFAEQKNRVSILATTISELLFRSAQIVTLILYHNYYIFLILLIVERLFNNSICNIYVIQHHPYLKSVKGGLLTIEKKKQIFSTVKPLFVNQLANTVQLSSRSILISALLGNVSIVGYFGNYQLIMNVIQLIYSQIGGTFTSSFGNLAVDGSTDKLRSTYYKSSFIMNWIAAICCSGFICASSKFIYLIFGEHFVLNTSCLVVLTLDLIIYLLNIPMISIQNALGLHKIDAKYMVIQAFLAIVLGYVFGLFWGMTGIFIGLMIPVIIFTTIIKGIKICKDALNMRMTEYFQYIGKEFLKIIITVFFAYLLSTWLNSEYSLMSLIISLLISVVIGVAFPLIMSIHRNELKFVLQLVNRHK